VSRTATAALSALGRRIAEPPISWLMKQTLEHPGLISLAAGFTDNPSLPVAETSKVLRELLADSGAAQVALQYGSTPGDAALRQLTARHLQALDTGRTTRNVSPAWSPDRLLITHGSQQLLYMITEALCDEGDIVIVEDPTYFVFLGIAQSRALRCRGVPLTPQGLDLDALERLLDSLHRAGDLKRLKFVYLVTYHQNPSGLTSTLANKRAVLTLLRHYERRAGHPIFLVEDAAYRELRFGGKDVPSLLKVKGAESRVIYAGTYSKPFATGIRVGFGVLPEALFTTMARIKGNHDFGTAHLLQQILVGALASGRYDAHLADLRVRYAHKAAVMKAALLEHFPPFVEWCEPDGGLYFWARLPGRMKTGRQSRVFREALAGGVLYVPGELCYADDPSRDKPDCEMRLSYGGASEKLVPEGIRRLGAVIRAHA
jgi:2-aminoadipate transaminase